MPDKQSINPSENDENLPQIIDTLDDVDEENSEKEELSIYGLAAQLKNIITQCRMDRAKRKHERKT